MTLMPTVETRMPYGMPPDDGPVAQLLIGRTPVMHELRAFVRRVGQTSLPVLIEGPTGSGKELVARAIHAVSGRTGRFVPLNIAAIGESLFEDALFGHVKGAFTGATGRKAGQLMEAHRGTCFFDEIGALPLALQPKLLRAIDAGSFRCVGADIDSASDFRLVAATNESVKRLVRLGRFREDLAFRLGAVVIAVPPLRDRIEDIPLLAQHFATQNVGADGVAVRWSGGALRALQDNDWPGNVRELKHAVDRVMAFADGPIVSAADVRRHSGTLGASSAERAWDERRRAELREVLCSVSWDTGKAAAILGIDRTTVYRRMRRLGIAIPQWRVDPDQALDR